MESNPESGQHKPPSGKPDTSGDRNDAMADCDRVSAIRSDNDFNTRLYDMWDKIFRSPSTNYDEDGWVRDVSGEDYYPIKCTPDGITYSSLELQNLKLIERVHSHPDGNFTPSFGDIEALCHDFNKK